MALISTRAKWRSSLSGWSSVKKKWKKVLDNAGIVRDAMFPQLSRATVTNPCRAFLDEGVHLVRPSAADSASLVSEQLIQICVGCFPRNVGIDPSGGYALVDTLCTRLRIEN